MAKQKTAWEWRPSKKVEHPVRVEVIGGSSDGDVLYQLTADSLLTFAELKALAVWLVGDFARDAEADAKKHDVRP